MVIVLSALLDLKNSMICHLTFGNTQPWNPSNPPSTHLFKISSVITYVIVFSAKVVIMLRCVIEHCMELAPLAFIVVVVVVVVVVIA